MIRVILFEDKKAFRETLEFYWRDSEKIYLAASFEEADDALKIIRKYKPDVVLMDIQLPGISGIEALQELHKYEPEVPILIQTIFEDNHRIFCAICGGASGYVLKSAGPGAIEEAIIDVHNGGGYFSPAIALKVAKLFRNELVQGQATFVELTKVEEEVLKSMCKGLSYELIADDVKRKYDVVHFHIKNIYKKLHVNSMPEAVAKAIANRLI